MNKQVKSDLGNKEIFASNLNRYLAMSGKIQKEVAEAVGVTAATFCDWTKARAYPRMDKVQLLAEYFGVRKSDLVEDGNKVDADQEVLDLFHQVPEEKREFVLSMIRAAVNNL